MACRGTCAEEIRREDRPHLGQPRWLAGRLSDHLRKEARSVTTYQRHVRWYQAPLYQHLVNVENCRASMIAHRRWGKDETVLGASNERMHRRVGTYWHCLPEYAQARKRSEEHTSELQSLMRISYAVFCLK